MKKNMLVSALCCLLALLLGGCQALELLEQVQAEREASASSATSGGSGAAPSVSRPSSGGAPSVPRSTGIAMLVQSYEHGDIIEIPQIEAAGSQAVERINQSIMEFAADYSEYLGGHPDDYHCEIKTWPFVDDQYVQIVMTSLYFPTYGTDGEVAGFVYDIRQDTVVEMESALEAAGTSARQMEEEFKRWGGARDLFVPGDVKSFELKAFVFTTAGMRFVFETEIYFSEAADSWKHIYSYHSESRQFYQNAALLFEPEEASAFDPPLYCNSAEIPGAAGEWTSYDYETKQIKARMTLEENGSCRVQFFDTGLETSGSWKSYADCLEVHLERIGITTGRVSAIGMHAGENFYYFEPVMGGGAGDLQLDQAVMDVLSQAIGTGRLDGMSVLELTDESRLDLMDQYFWPARRLGLDSQTWTSPEQMDPETLLEYYEFYDFELVYLAEHHPEIDFHDMAMDGKEFWVPREIVEESIHKFVPVPAERLRTSWRYSAEQQAYRMVLMFGKGDGVWSELARAWQADDILLLEISTDGDTDYLLLDRSGDNPVYLAAAHVPFDG
ncbi:hypothetical protein LJC63_13055 [Ruminococcaceae bacterium OttesenSCG-928-L11]|nr:hypothetical protein [Ruminococcaceae bacterium OttesenSCG-928-L11]